MKLNIVHATRLAGINDVISYALCNEYQETGKSGRNSHGVEEVRPALAALKRLQTDTQQTIHKYHMCTAYTQFQRHHNVPTARHHAAVSDPSKYH